MKKEFSVLPVTFGKIYIFATFLFGLWHIGYAIGIYLWQGGNLLRCIIMKVLWRTLYGKFNNEYEV